MKGIHSLSINLRMTGEPEAVLAKIRSISEVLKVSDSIPENETAFTLTEASAVSPRLERKRAYDRERMRKKRKAEKLAREAQKARARADRIQGVASAGANAASAVRGQNARVKQAGRKGKA